MVDGQLESILSQLHYATRTLSPVRLGLQDTLFLLLHCTGAFLCFWGVLTRLDYASSGVRRSLRRRFTNDEECNGPSLVARFAADDELMRVLRSVPRNIQ